MSEVANEVVTRFVEITKEEPNRCGWLIECSLQRTGELFRFVDPAPGDRGHILLKTVHPPELVEGGHVEILVEEGEGVYLSKIAVGTVFQVRDTWYVVNDEGILEHHDKEGVAMGSDFVYTKRP